VVNIGSAPTDKSSTYKLALLRVLCRIADGTAGYARMVEGAPHWIELPLGLVALFWLRQYMPLLKAGLPQQHLSGHAPWSCDKASASAA